MKIALKIVFVVVVALLLAQPGSVLAQKGKPSSNVIYLQAALRDFATDGVRSDVQGPYVSGADTSVQIDVDGHLTFFLAPGCGRTVRLDFTDQLRAGEPGLFPPGPGDPVNGLNFFTMALNGALNFRMMTPGQVSTADLWFQFNSASGLEFWLRGGADAPISNGQVGGHLQVTALDTNSDGRVDRWVVEPLPDTDSKFQLFRRIRQKQSYVNKDYGDYRLPFTVTFDRLN